jgi:hypothetical protein
MKAFWNIAPCSQVSENTPDFCSGSRLSSCSLCHILKASLTCLLSNVYLFSINGYVVVLFNVM